jgi:hypothetical protein
MIFFHIMGVLVMIFGTVLFTGSMVMGMVEGGVLRRGGEFAWLRFLIDISAGVFVFVLGAILFVLAEIASRVGRPIRLVSRSRGYEDD